MAEHFDTTEDAGIESADVVTKYSEAGRVANQALTKVMAAVVEGALILDICKLGDEFIEKEVATLYTKKVEGQPILKGVAFPTCVSVNNVICHFSPLVSEASIALKAGDVVKVELGVHIDGYAATVGNTAVIGGSKDNAVSGRVADAIVAARSALEVALRLVKPGNLNTQVTAAIQKVVESYGCKPIEGMLSHQLSRFDLAGEKSIILNPSDANPHAEHTFEVNEAYAVDVLVSTGSGKGRESDHRATVFQRTGNDYQLKMQASRNFVSEVNKKFINFPFSLRSCESESKARLGLSECLTHQVLQPFPIYVERDGEIVVQFKTTILLTANGTQRLTTPQFEEAAFKSEKSIADPDLKALLQTPLGKSKKKKEKKPDAQATPAASS